MLREGDELLEVNGVPVARRSTDEIVRLMVSDTQSLKVLLQPILYLFSAFLIQSGEAGVTLAFTIIPIHDDNIDTNYEPVSSSMSYSTALNKSPSTCTPHLLHYHILPLTVSLSSSIDNPLHPSTIRNMCVHISTTLPRQMKRFPVNLWGSSLRKEIFWKLVTKMTPTGGR